MDNEVFTKETSSPAENEEKLTGLSLEEIKQQIDQELEGLGDVPHQDEYKEIKAGKKQEVAAKVEALVNEAGSTMSAKDAQSLAKKLVSEEMDGLKQRYKKRNYLVRSKKVIRDMENIFDVNPDMADKIDVAMQRMDPAFDNGLMPIEMKNDFIKGL